MNTASGTRIRTYIAGLGLLASGLAIYCLSSASIPRGEDLAIAIVLSAFAAIAFRYPIHFDFKSSIILDTSIILSGVLLFSPGIAMMIILADALASNLSRRFEIEEMTFNMSQSLLQTGVAGGVLLATGWRFGSRGLGWPTGITLAWTDCRHDLPHKCGARRD